MLRDRDLLHTALGKWKDSERRDGFLAVEHHKCQTTNVSLQDLLLILAVRLQEGDGRGSRPLLRTPKILQDKNASEGPGPSRAEGCRKAALSQSVLGTLCWGIIPCMVQWENGIRWDKLERTLGKPFQSS